MQGLLKRSSLLAGPLAFVAACATAPTVPPEAIADLAPSGKLRVAINYGNAVLAQKDPATGEAKGVSADLARELGRRLGVPLEIVTYDAAGKVADAVKTGAWDVAFIAIDPQRAVDIAFTAPYVIIEGGYLVRKDSPLKAIEDFDRKGVRIAVGNKSVYDLHLARTLKNAELVRAPTTPAAVPLFLDNRLEAAAGIKGPLVRYAQTNPEVRVIPGRFMAIEQAMAVPKAREAGVRYLRRFVEEMKASGFVAEGLQRSGQHDATVAPPAS
jgi:polar amino acid transport system substrate-binding protein